MRVVRRERSLAQRCGCSGRGATRCDTSLNRPEFATFALGSDAPTGSPSPDAGHPRRLAHSTKTLAPQEEGMPAKTKRKPNAAFMKPLQPDAALAEVVGAKPLPRTEVTKKLWAYIKKHGLQDAKNKRMINPDEKLAAVFGGKKQVSMFEMTKLVSKHVK
jgi:chromatin remodeling complex protein RSC6